MRQLGLGFAYFCIYTTPIQLGFILWQLIIILTSDYTFLSLSTKSDKVKKFERVGRRGFDAKKVDRISKKSR